MTAVAAIKPSTVGSRRSAASHRTIAEQNHQAQPFSLIVSNALLNQVIYALSRQRYGEWSIAFPSSHVSRVTVSDFAGRYPDVLELFNMPCLIQNTAVLQMNYHISKHIHRQIMRGNQDRCALPIGNMAK